MKIAVLSSHTTSLFWFRMDMMKSFQQCGHKVIALGPDSELEWKTKFEECGIQYKQLYVKRNTLNPFDDLKTYQQLKRFMKNEKPDKVFAYQAKTVVYGSLAAKAIGITEVYTLIAGLGSIFRGDGFRSKIIKIIMKVEYLLAFKASKKVFLQNNDDKDELIKNRIIKAEKITVINGSGVNLDEFLPRPVLDTSVFLFIGRLIKDKGIVEYLEACKRIKNEYPQVECLLVGPFDSNPSALQKEELQSYIDKGIIEYFGEQDDVRPYLNRCSTYVLPSYHEGTPKTVLEAMAVGRAIITSDAPGCKETVVHGHNGYLVPIKDIDAVYEKMKLLVNNHILSKYMGERSLELAREKYDVKIVNRAIMNTMGLL